MRSGRQFLGRGLAGLGLLLLFLGMRPALAQLQPRVVSGYVRDSTSGETLLGANVVARGLTIGTATNSYGFFSFRIPQGVDTIEVSYVGYAPRRLVVAQIPDSVITVYLRPDATIAEVLVEGQQHHEGSRSARMGTVSIPKRAMLEAPMLLGERDVMRVVQLMPGVQKGREGTSGLYVRGGGAGQNLIILDDAPVYNAHHLLGFFSLFNGQAIKSIELVKGGFPARYGGRLASVLDIVMDDGNLREYHGSVGVGFVAANASVQGPIVKDKASFLVTARRTYIDALLRPFMSLSTGVPSLYFYDFTAKVNWQVNPRDRLYLSGYFGRDKFGLREKDDNNSESEFGLWWGNATGTLRWNHVFSPSLFMNATGIYSLYRFSVYADLRFAGEHFWQRFYSGIQNGGVKIDFQWQPHAWHTVRFGGAALGYQFTPSAVEARSEMLGQDTRDRVHVYSAENALYVEDDMRLWGWGRLNAGFRLSHYATKNLNRVSVEPRLSTSIYLTDRLSAKASFAMMTQHLHMLMRTGFGLPTDLWVPATRKLPPQRSWIVAAGLTQDLPWNLTASLEGYYKRSRGVLHYREGAGYFSPGDALGSTAGFWENRVVRGSSWSAGVEFLLQRRVGNLNGWIGYTLSWTRMQFSEINNGRSFWAGHDRRHDVAVVLMYHINSHWRVSGTWVYGTGNAFTLPVALYDGAGLPLSKHHSTRRIMEYGEYNGMRMGAYHRMDVGVQWVKQKRYYERVVSFDIYNVYNRKNPFFYLLDTQRTSADGKLQERVQVKKASLFPIIPSVSITFNF